ncbi:MAG TPA: hypothetical protein PK158_13050 [Spirochaetota bacterium]|nr:hypothetical protein [Spirochaetota bacterium]
MHRVINILMSLYVFFLSFSLNSQVDHAGTVIKIKGGEITVRNENPDAPFVMGETLRLLTGDKSVLLQVTFAMQTSAKCKLVTGSIRKLKIGSLVYSGGIPENPVINIIKMRVNTNVKSMKIDDFEIFLGLKKGDTIDKAERILGMPTEKSTGLTKSDQIPDTSIENSKGDIWKNSTNYYWKNSTNYYWKNSTNYYWENEENCYVNVCSQTKHNKISNISVSSSFYKFNNNLKRSFYLDTTREGIVHYLRSRGIIDAALNLFGLFPQDIVKILGNPEKVSKSEDNSYYIYHYKTSSGNSVSFHFNINEDKLYYMSISFK